MFPSSLVAQRRRRVDARGSAKLGLGKLAFNKGEIDKALELFKGVIATAPGTPQAAEAEAFVKALGKKDR